MPLFAELKCDDDIKEIIKSAFDTDIDISGAWGYTKVLATVVHSSQMPLPQLEYTIVSMRAYIQMNMTLPIEDRFGSIGLKEIDRKQHKEGNSLYDEVTYDLTAMKEDIYTSFIKEYKEGYGTESFNIVAHFEERKKATLTKKEVHWFNITPIQN